MLTVFTDRVLMKEDGASRKVMNTLEDQKKDLVEESLIYVQPMEIFKRFFN